MGRYSSLVQELNTILPIKAQLLSPETPLHVFREKEKNGSIVLDWPKDNNGGETIMQEIAQWCAPVFGKDNCELVISSQHPHYVLTIKNLDPERNCLKDVTEGQKIALRSTILSYLPDNLWKKDGLSQVEQNFAALRKMLSPKRKASIACNLLADGNVEYRISGDAFMFMDNNPWLAQLQQFLTEKGGECKLNTPFNDDHTLVVTVTDKLQGNLKQDNWSVQVAGFQEIKNRVSDVVRTSFTAASTLETSSKDGEDVKMTLITDALEDEADGQTEKSPESDTKFSNE